MGGMGVRSKPMDDLTCVHSSPMGALSAAHATPFADRGGELS